MKKGYWKTFFIFGLFFMGLELKILFVILFNREFRFFLKFNIGKIFLFFKNLICFIRNLRVERFYVITERVYFGVLWF